MEDRGVDRRDFLKSAVAIGGTSALSACLERESSPPMGATDFYDDLESPYPDRQHEIGPHVVLDPHGNTILPMHHSLIFLDYVGDGPTDEERTRVENAFRTLETAYQWGVEDQSPVGGPVLNEGLIFLIGYSPYYFDIYGERPERPAMDAEQIVEELDDLGGLDGETTPDTYDAYIYLTSDLANAVLGAEEALFSNVDEINGVEVKGGLDGIFEKKERRTGFVGRAGNIIRSSAPREKFEETKHADAFDENPVPESSPLWMGFASGFTDNLPPEDKMTIQEGPFAGGTVAQISRTKLDLEKWYKEDHEDRVEMMFSPRHDKEKVGETGQSLASSSRTSEDIADAAEVDARERGVVGHAQKLAEARDDDFDPKVIRRDFDSTDGSDARMEFMGFTRRIEDFVELQEAMRGEHLDTEPERNGILDFFEAPNRATYLVPPRRLRALPPANPDV